MWRGRGARTTGGAETAVSKGAWASHLVLVEAVWALDSAYGLSAKQIALAVEMLLDHATLSVQDADVVGRALELYRARPKLEFSDCLILEVGQRQGHAPLTTFDRRLGAVDGVERI